MKLSDLVNYRNELNRFQLEEARTKFDLDVAHTKHIINNKDSESSNLYNQIESKHNEIHTKFNEFVDLIEQAKQEVNDEIKLKEQFWLEETYKLYSQEMVNDSDEHILNRRPSLSEEHENMIRSRIVGFSNAKQPGMIIRPGLETFIRNMVMFDPLYLVDRSENMLFPSTLEFPELYQRRLRYYTVDEYDQSKPILERLPDEQFGLCLAYNFFNFKPIQAIERYLSELFVKLKPGGKLMMTFNDCDNEKAVRLAESYYACYTPGRMVKEIAQRIGYEIYFVWTDGGPSTWIELQKPGVLTSLRGGQALAKIHHLPDPNWQPEPPGLPDPNHAHLKDCIVTQTVYNPEEHDFYKHMNLKHQILTLGLITEENINFMTTRQLEELLDDHENKKVNQKT